jgi:hypothetical protein
VLHTAPGSARGGHFSKGLSGYNIGNVQQFLKNTEAVPVKSDINVLASSV